MDSPFFKSKECEDHLPFTLFYLNKTGQFLDNNYYINGARNAILIVVKSYPQISSNLYFNYLNRGLDDQLMINCKSIIKEKDPNLDNIYYLFSSTSL